MLKVQHLEQTWMHSNKKEDMSCTSSVRGKICHGRQLARMKCASCTLLRTEKQKHSGIYVLFVGENCRIFVGFKF
jgi:hypothetical protein